MLVTVKPYDYLTEFEVLINSTLLMCYLSLKLCQELKALGEQLDQVHNLRV